MLAILVRCPLHHQMQAGGTKYIAKKPLCNYYTILSENLKLKTQKRPIISAFVHTSVQKVNLSFIF